MQDPSVEMRGIVKTFGAVTASDQVDFFRQMRGRFTRCSGRTGQGKSTVMSMLSGVYRADAGEILIHGKPARIRSPKDAALLGVGMVFQNFRLVQSLTAAENIVLGEKVVFLARQQMD
ncbi:ATP-binding cassette domain-containing protein [Paenibacillus rhizoplanae]